MFHNIMLHFVHGQLFSLHDSFDNTLICLFIIPRYILCSGFHTYKMWHEYTTYSEYLPFFFAFSLAKNTHPTKNNKFSWKYLSRGDIQCENITHVNAIFPKNVFNSLSVERVEMFECALCCVIIMLWLYMSVIPNCKVNTRSIFFAFSDSNPYCKMQWKRADT